MKTPIALAAALLVALVATPASAQARGYISVNALAQPSNASLSDHFTYPVNAETATADVTYPSKVGIGGEGGAGIRLWKQLGAGVAVSYVSNSGDAEINAQIPHPFFFNQPRAVSGTQTGVGRSETAVHLQVLYFLPSTGKLRAVLSGGPSYVSLRQDVVDEILHKDVYPYDTATLSLAPTSSETASAIGFNVGADIRWMFNRSFGVGGIVRFTRAQVDLDVNGRSLGVDTGGVQAGAGVRIGF